MRNLILSWDPDVLQRVKEKNKQRHNLTYDQFNSDVYFNVDWWQQRLFIKILQVCYVGELGLHMSFMSKKLTLVLKNHYLMN